MTSQNILIPQVLKSPLFLFFSHLTPPQHPLPPPSVFTHDLSRKVIKQNVPMRGT